MKIITQTSRLIIREFKPEEEHLFLDIDGDDQLTKYIPKRTVQESKQVFAKTLGEYTNTSGLGRWGIFNHEDTDFIGVCFLKPSEYDQNRIELGYRFHVKYWGSGMATELAKAVVAYGFDQVKLQEINAVTHPDNAASQRVLSKVGFKYYSDVFWYNEMVPLFKINKAEKNSDLAGITY